MLPNHVCLRQQGSGAIGNTIDNMIHDSIIPLSRMLDCHLECGTVKDVGTHVTNMLQQVMGYVDGKEKDTKP